MPSESFMFLVKRYEEKFGDFVPFTYIETEDAEIIRQAIESGEKLFEGGSETMPDDFAT